MDAMEIATKNITNGIANTSSSTKSHAITSPQIELSGFFPSCIGACKTISSPSAISNFLLIIRHDFPRLRFDRVAIVGLGGAETSTCPAEVVEKLAPQPPCMRGYPLPVALAHLPNKGDQFGDRLLGQV
jgi:hypothetical protein